MQHPWSAKSWLALLKGGFQSRFVSQYSAAITATLRNAEDATFCYKLQPPLDAVVTLAACLII